MPFNQALDDELEAVSSIYDGETLKVTSNNHNDNDGDDVGDVLLSTTTETVLRLPNLPFSFVVSFPRSYPDVPPLIVGTESVGVGAKRGDGEAALGVIRDVLGRVYVPGQVCLFDLIEEVSPLLEQQQQQQRQEKQCSPTATQALAPDIEDGEGDSSHENLRTQNGHYKVSSTSVSNASPLLDDLGNLHIKDLVLISSVTTTSNAAPIPATTSTSSSAVASIAPNWTVSQPLLVNKSNFVARALAVHSLTAATEAITHLLSTDKKVASATHNITAWRLRFPPSSTPQAGGSTTNEIIIQDCDDDGETAAGARLLHLMQLMDVWNVVVVVTRWYGGVKLGGDRFRCINAVARDALVRGGFAGTDDDAATTGKTKGTGSGKKNVKRK